MKKIDHKLGSFVANGNTYYIKQYITVGRDVRFTNLVPQLMFGTDFKGIFTILSKINKLTSSGNDVLGAITQINMLTFNMLEAIKTVGTSGYPLYYELCALFINREGENEGPISDDQIKAKIDDWLKEDFDREDFFLLSIHSIDRSGKLWRALMGKVEEVTQ